MGAAIDDADVVAGQLEPDRENAADRAGSYDCCAHCFLLG
jgi:hypothetical protein